MTDYKEDQKQTRAKLKEHKVLWSKRETLDLGIRRMKKQLNNSYLISTYKKNAWESAQSKK